MRSLQEGELGVATEEAAGASTWVGGNAVGRRKAGCDGGVDSAGVLQEAAKKTRTM